MSKEAVKDFSTELKSLLDFAREVAEYHDCNKIRASLNKISGMVEIGMNETLIDLFISRTYGYWTDKDYANKIICDIVGTLDDKGKDIVKDTPRILIGKLKDSVELIVPHCLTYVYHKREPVIVDGKTKFTVVCCPGLSISKAKKIIS